MIDFRIETFLMLCKIRSYTETARKLHITQPAVTQHIKYLEKYYDVKLFYYEGSKLMLTSEGEVLKEYAKAMKANSNRMKVMLKNKKDKYPIKFGATLTVAEYKMEPILEKVLLDKPYLDITMEVDNTSSLLGKLSEGEIDFAIVEGYFDKLKYESEILSVERFIPICSPNNKMSKKKVEFTELFNNRLIIREKGSGTREVFEQALYENNSTINSFDNIVKIGNMNMIKKLVKKDMGITFLYDIVVKEELRKKEIVEININRFKINRTFNFVFLKNSIYKEEYIKWFKYFKSII